MQSEPANENVSTRQPRSGRMILIMLLIVAPAFYWFTFGKRNRAEEAALASTRQALSTLPSYPENRDYLDTVLDAEHRPAFRQAYRMGGRRRSASFDEVQYWNVLVTRLADRCARDNRSDLATELSLHLTPGRGIGR